MYLVEYIIFFDSFHLRMIFPKKLDCNPTYKKHPPWTHRGVYSAASGEDIVTFNSSSSNGDIVPNTVRALKGRLCELLGYNRFRQTLLTSDGVARTQEKPCNVFFFVWPCIRLCISRNDILVVTCSLLAFVLVFPLRIRWEFLNGIF